MIPTSPHVLQFFFSVPREDFPCHSLIISIFFFLPIYRSILTLILFLLLIFWFNLAGAVFFVSLRVFAETRCRCLGCTTSACGSLVTGIATEPHIGSTRLETLFSFTRDFCELWAQTSVAYTISKWFEFW